MARRKEYLPIGKNSQYNVYHQTYDRYRVQSRILNGRERHPSIDTIFWDKNRILWEIEWIEGNSKGMAYDPKVEDEGVALIPSIKKELQKLQRDFKNYQIQIVNQGHFKPNEMPVGLFNKKLQLEAKFDVLKEELNELKRRLSSIKKEEEEEHQNLLLAYGAASAGSLHNGILVELDGQTISLNKKNALIISDPLSPYRGLLVADYREYISKPWRLATEKIRNEKAALSRQLLSRGLYEEQFNEKWDTLRKRIISENGWEDLFALKLPGKPLIPKIPKNLFIEETCV